MRLLFVSFRQCAGRLSALPIFPVLMVLFVFMMTAHFLIHSSESPALTFMSKVAMDPVYVSDKTTRNISQSLHFDNSSSRSNYQSSAKTIGNETKDTKLLAIIRESIREKPTLKPPSTTDLQRPSLPPETKPPPTPPTTTITMVPEMTAQSNNNSKLTEAILLMTKEKTQIAEPIDSSANNYVFDGCPFQEVDPFDPQHFKHILKRPPVDCSHGLPIVVYIDGQNNIRVNMTKANATIGQVEYCKYSRVELADKDDSTLRPFNWSSKFLLEPLPLTNDDEHIFAQCFFNNTIVSQMFKSRVLIKPKVEERSQTNYKRHVQENAPLETMSVLIVGIDGVSKQNLARTMPKTRDFIMEKLNAKELNKFNKLGYSTYPNIIALHTGYNESDLHKYWSPEEHYDVIEDKTIWHHYQNAGYRTGMGFDVTWMTAYHYLKKGWKNPTFDYYSRILRLAIERGKPARKAGKDCVGDIPELVVLQDSIIQMATLFNTKTKPYFIYNFYSKLTHGLQAMAARGDDIYFNFFQELHKRNALNNTITVFFSDHGPRFGDFRFTFNGKIETNSPFVFIMFPPWFEKKYPEVMATFKINQNRLTTFFDIHKTLKDLLNFDGKTKKASVDSRAISLLDEIPKERTCHHAAIPMEFCNCKLLSQEPVSEQITGIVSKFMTEAIINRTSEIRNICALLSLNKVKSVLTVWTYGQTFPHYQVTVVTKPGGGMYEAVMRYDPVRRQASLVGDIARLNFFQGQDWCVDTRAKKLYCYCQKEE